MTNEDFDDLFASLTEGSTCEKHMLSITTAVVCAGLSLTSAVDHELDVVFDDMARRDILRTCNRHHLESLLRAVGENWKEKFSTNEDIDKRT